MRRVFSIALVLFLVVTAGSFGVPAGCFGDVTCPMQTVHAVDGSAPVAHSCCDRPGSDNPDQQPGHDDSTPGMICCCATPGAIIAVPDLMPATFVIERHVMLQQRSATFGLDPATPPPRLA